MEKGRSGRNFRRGILFAAVFVLFLPAASEAGSADPAGAATLQGACDIAFFVPSTLHDVSGFARCNPFAVPIVRDASGREIIPFVKLEVPVAGMDTRNRSRDRQMRNMFQSDRYPRIVGTVRDVDVGRLRAEIGKGREGKAPLDLSLGIRDAERKIHAVASHLKETRGMITFDLEFPLSLGEFGLSPPSVLGIIRVGDRVSVKANFTLTVSRNSENVSKFPENGENP